MGVVEESGPGASKFVPGDRVTAAPFPSVPGGSGTWQQFVVAKESDLIPVPEGVSDEAAAQFWVNPVTVYGMLDVLQVSEEGACRQAYRAAACRSRSRPPAHSLAAGHVEPRGLRGAALQVPKGEWLLQTAAGSVLGCQMIQVRAMRAVLRSPPLHTHAHIR